MKIYTANLTVNPRAYGIRSAALPEGGKATITLAADDYTGALAKLHRLTRNLYRLPFNRANFTARIKSIGATSVSAADYRNAAVTAAVLGEERNVKSLLAESSREGRAGRSGSEGRGRRSGGGSGRSYRSAADVESELREALLALG